MLQIGHRQHQRGGRIGPRDGGDDPARLRERRTGAAMLARHDLRDQPRAMQPCEVLVRKAPIDVVARRVGGKFRREALEQRGDACVVGIVGGQEAQRGRLRRRRGSGKAGGHRNGFPG
ncbi:hypothetical protein CSX04_03668 [Burkholderia cepacia]|nr:hypothetical protein CSX04_03668 [Burkholderia cepacia]